MKLVRDGESVFLTGGAGTGKSYTLAHVVAALQRRHGKGSVFVTGSTGIAACHIGGTTVHSCMPRCGARALDSADAA